LKTPFEANSFEGLGVEKDFVANESSGKPADGIAWTHRAAPGIDIILYRANKIKKEKSIYRSIEISKK